MLSSDPAVLEAAHRAAGEEYDRLHRLYDLVRDGSAGEDAKDAAHYRLDRAWDVRASAYRRWQMSL